MRRTRFCWPQQGHGVAWSRSISSWLRSRRSVLIESGTCRCARWAAARHVTFGKGRCLAVEELFFDLLAGLGPQPLGHKEAIGGNAQAGVMVEPPPAAALVVGQPEVLLE